MALPVIISFLVGHDRVSIIPKVGPSVKKFENHCHCATVIKTTNLKMAAALHYQFKFPAVFCRITLLLCTFIDYLGSYNSYVPTSHLETDGSLI